MWNNRVLEYDRPFRTAVFADRVFGQLGFFTTNDANKGGGPSADTLNQPAGLAVDKSNNLYVADFANARVLKYQTPLTATAVSGSGDTTADLVFGKSSFTGAGSN